MIVKNVESIRQSFLCSQLLHHCHCFDVLGSRALYALKLLPHLTELKLTNHQNVHLLHVVRGKMQMLLRKKEARKQMIPQRCVISYNAELWCDRLTYTDCGLYGLARCGSATCCSQTNFLTSSNSRRSRLATTREVCWTFEQHKNRFERKALTLNKQSSYSQSSLQFYRLHQFVHHSEKILAIMLFCASPKVVLLFSLCSASEAKWSLLHTWHHQRLNVWPLRPGLQAADEYQGPAANVVIKLENQNISRN